MHRVKATEGHGLFRPMHLKWTHIGVHHADLAFCGTKIGSSSRMASDTEQKAAMCPKCMKHVEAWTDMNLSAIGYKAGIEVVEFSNVTPACLRCSPIQPPHAATSIITDYWAILFDDADVDPEIFTDEECARHRFEQVSQNYNCHLFHQV